MTRETPSGRERQQPLALLVVGAGPTGLSLGAEARLQGLEDVLLVDRGPVASALLRFPTYMRFFTTRERMQIGGLPFAIAEDKPDRRQALVYYQAVAQHHRLAITTYENIESVTPDADLLRVVTSSTRKRGEESERQLVRWARQVVLATGYFDFPRSLGVVGEDQPWVHHRYSEAFGHFGERVALIGGGNTAAEAALELWRNGIEVTIIHRRAELKPSIKYWLKPDIDNRISEGSIAAHLSSTVTRFDHGRIELDTPNGPTVLAADAAYVLIGYEPDGVLERRCGIEVDPDTLAPHFDAETFETNVPGLYVAGAVQAGKNTNKIFIDNSRDHAKTIIANLVVRARR